MPKIRITHSGLCDEKGKRLPIGEVLNKKEVPESWVNKYEIVTGKTLEVATPKGE